MSSDISRILQRGESETSEFKGARAPLDALAKAVCGMLNQRGGILIWGVDEQGQPIGVDRAEERAKELSDFLIRHLNSRPLFSVSAIPVAKKRLVVVDVPPGADKPYSMNREIWVRCELFPTAKIKTGPIGNDAIMEGPAIRVLKDVVVMVQQRTGFSGTFDKEKLERQDRPAYALFALREGLVNAMVHRDYASIGGYVQIEIFPDRLTIRNPGRLPKGWTTEDLARKHESHPANPDTARVFYLRGLMEQLGMGTQKLIASCKELDAKAPLWATERDTVSLTLFAATKPAAEGKLADRQMRFLDSTKVGVGFKVTDYADAVNVSERQARRDLTELENRGLIERHGKGPATSYRRTARTLT